MIELIIKSPSFGGVGEAFGRLELPADTKIKYTKQISDIFNIAKVNASYTNAFNVPKTPENTAILDCLGLVGSTSKIPYQKTPVTVRENGIDLIKNGWLEVKETSDFYKINIIDGAIDFFKQIENSYLSDVDLSKIDHVKNPLTIRNSHSNPFYRYILADYGGRKHTDFNHFYADYLVPSARYKHLIEQIARHFGWTFWGSVFSNSDYLNSWITYPKAIEEPTDDFQNVGFFKKNPTNFYVGQSFTIESWDVKSIATIDSKKFLSEQNGKITVKETNSYRIKVEAKGLAYYKDGQTYYFSVHQNFDVNHPLVVGNSGNQKTYEGILNVNKIIEFVVSAPPYYPYGAGYYMEMLDYINISYLQVTIYKNKSATVSFTEEFKNIRITDFFNDFLRRFALTPVFDNDNRSVTFYTLAERLNRNNAVDWSDKFIRRDKETYLYGSYGQRNYFRHKYNSENQSFSDGILQVDNQNLPSEKTLFQSVFYSFENRYVTILGRVTPVYPIWETEISEKDNGQIEFSYKSLNGRFYFVQTQKGTFSGLIAIVSEKNPQNASGLSGPQASVVSPVNTTYKELIGKNYGGYKNLLNGCKVHSFTMALSIADVVNLDFTKPIYIKQEASYYLLNKVEYQNGGRAKVEAVRMG